MNSTLSILTATFLINVGTFANTQHIDQDGVLIDVTLTPSTFLVGETITLKIHALTRDDKKLSLSDELALKQFTVTDEFNLLDIPTEQGRSWHWTLQLDTFDATVTSLSGLSVDWLDVQGDTGSISIKPIPVEVTSAAGASLENQTLRDLKNAVPLYSSSNWQLATWAFIGVCFVLLTVKLLRKKPVGPSPNEQAMHALQLLQSAKLEPLPFYTELSDIVRRYVEGRFKIAATGQTTREFLTASKQSPHLEQCDRQLLSTFLVAADLVKFARFEPSGDACNKAIIVAEEFISATDPYIPELVEVAA